MADNKIDNNAMDIDNDMDIDVDVDNSDDIKDNTRSISDILKELSQKTEKQMNLYNNAISTMNNIMKSIDIDKTVYVNIAGKKRTFTEFIEECADKSKQQIKDGRSMNFGELLLEGLENV